jgi:hypothetical protein
MQLTDDDIHEFQMIWQTEFGEALPADKARAPASQLMNLILQMAKEEELTVNQNANQ